MTPTTLVTSPTTRRSSGSRVVHAASGLLVLFAAVGAGAWLSGAASWAAFYLGARGSTLTGVAQATAAAGFALTIVLTIEWYRRRCRRGEADVPARAVLAACVVLAAGNIFWAIFVDAVAYHYGQDIVRPAFDYVIMYLILGGVLPLFIGVPWLAFYLRGRPTGPVAVA